MRWVGIDEAGYGPNLGPLVMTAVVAEGPDERPPDLWADLAPSISRAGGPPGALWVDDSKKVHKARRGLDRLETATMAALGATGRAVPTTLLGLLDALGAGTSAEVELDLWLEPGSAPPAPRLETRPMLDRALASRPFDGAPWRLHAIRCVVMGPACFNRALEATGSKALAHFGAFASLLRPLWDEPGPASVRADKHGGRHFYRDPLARVFPEAEIDRGMEGPAGSRYTIRGTERHLELELCPRADADDGLVALASMVSKAVRERWMEVFNDHWTRCLPGLRPTAGYPVDAARFRAEIEPACRKRGLDPALYWRAR